MKAHKVTLVIIDFDELGEEETRLVLEETRYPNHCISPNVVGFETVDIGEWDDDHPLNLTATFDSEVKKIFKKEN